MDISSREAEIIKSFANIETWEEKYKKIIEWGKALPPLDEEFRQEKFKVKGCQSTIWLGARFKDGKIFFEADSDALIVKGIAALLIKVFSDLACDEVLKCDGTFLDQIGIRQHLSMNRSNGLSALIKQMKLYAQVFKLTGGKGV